MGELVYWTVEFHGGCRGTRNYASEEQALAAGRVWLHERGPTLVNTSALEQQVSSEPVEDWDGWRLSLSWDVEQRSVQHRDIVHEAVVGGETFTRTETVTTYGPWVMLTDPHVRRVVIEKETVEIEEEAADG